MTINTHTIVKSVLQARTLEPLPSSAAKASAALAYERLKDTTWRKVLSLASSVPPHDRTQTGFNDRYVACQYAGDYDEDTLEQHAYACAAVFTVAVPADALTGDPCNISSISFSTYIDQWLTNGAIVKAIVSGSATPPTLDEIAVAMYGVILSSPNSIENNVIYFPAETAADDYLHLVVLLNNYETANGDMIDGAVMLIDDSISVNYSRNVLADTIVETPSFPSTVIAYPRLEIGDGILYGILHYHTSSPSLFDRSTAAGRELACKQALSQFPYQSKTGSLDMSLLSGAGIKFFDVAGDIDDVSVYGTVMGMYYHAQQPCTVSRFVVKVGMPGTDVTGWTSGLHIRWTLYHVPGVWEIEVTTHETLNNPLFWQGRATSIIVGANRTVAVVPVASFIMPDGGFANNDVIPITPTLLDTKGTFFLVWSPEEVTDFDIPAAVDTFYGMSFKEPNETPEALFLE